MYGPCAGWAGLAVSRQYPFYYCARSSQHLIGPVGAQHRLLTRLSQDHLRWAARCSLTADVRKGTVGTPGGGSLHFVLGCSLHLIDLTRGESQDVDITLKSAE